MNPYEMMIPQILAGGVIVFFALRSVHRANRADVEHRADFERRMAAHRAEHDRHMAELRSFTAVESAAAHALDVQLDLTDATAIPDMAQATKHYGPLIEQVDAIETEFGGRGMAVTGFRAEPGEVVLTFTPRERADAPARLDRVAERINSAGYALPPGVAEARALPV